MIAGAEHLHFACTTCGDCCRRHRVALTHRDLARLKRVVGAPAESLVEWLSPEEVDLDAESASFVTLPEGPRLMVLAHVNAVCRFLTNDNRCSVYAARPRDCELYPFVLERDERRRVVRLALFDPKGCGERGTVAAKLDAIDRADARRWAEVEEYRGRVRAWNRMARHRHRFGHRSGTVKQFLASVMVVLLLSLAAESRASGPSAPPPALEPDCEGAHALTADVKRVVAGEESEGWFSDAEAFRSMDEHVLESACRATPDARALALAVLRAERARAGDARELHRAAGELTDAVEHALTAERELRALERALARTESECPFWVAPEPRFAGLQSDRRRITLNLETGGYFQLRETEDDWTFGGGGMGRLLVGWGIDGRTTLLFGPELGGGAMIRPGTSASQFVINYFPALPFVVRNHGLTWHWSTEAAAVALFQADDTRISFGGRVGGAFGLTALRTRNVLPWAGLAIDYEYYPRGGGRAPAHFIRGGLRFGFPWDP